MEPGEGVTAWAMRDALSSFATGVTIVTTGEHMPDGAIQPVGMTASSFNSVSMDPPLVLWSVTKEALSAPVFRAAKHFSIHVLSSAQVELSNRFAQKGADKFDGVNFSMDARSVPVLGDVACRFDCSAWNVYEGGDHWIIVGEVVKLERENAEGLVFSGGSYATASPLRPASSPVAPLVNEASPIDDMLIYNLARAYRQMSTQFHAGVRECGLSVPEWRILASLHGRAVRDLPDLAARTFIDPHALVDMLQSMQGSGLCEMSAPPAVGDPALRISGTAAGHARVEHLFELGRQHEKSALHEGEHGTGQNKRPDDGHKQDMQNLIALLQRVIANTSDAAAGNKS